MLGCQPSTLTQRSMHHQKSSSDSPFHANTLKPRNTQETGFFSHSATDRKSRTESLQDGTTRTQRVNMSEQQTKGRCRTQEAPRMSSLTSLCQGSCHFVLGGVDVAGRPSALCPQGWQSLHQHLRRMEIFWRSDLENILQKHFYVIMS